jgi:hypothetical protein
MCKRVMAASMVTSEVISNNEVKVNNRTKKAQFAVTPELCLAINNIDYVLQYIQPFVKELAIDEVIEKLRVLNGDLVANACKRTLATLVHNAVENVENKIFEV